MRLLPPVVFILATTVLVLTVGGGLFGWETSLLTPLSLLTVSLILLQAQHVQRAEPSQRIPGPSVLALSVIGLGLAIALLAYGVYNHDAAAEAQTGNTTTPHRRANNTTGSQAGDSQLSEVNLQPMESDSG